MLQRDEDDFVVVVVVGGGGEEVVVIEIEVCMHSVFQSTLSRKMVC